MSDFIFDTTPSIRQIHGGAAKLGEIIDSLPSASNGSDILFVTDPGVIKPGLAEKASYARKLVMV